MPCNNRHVRLPLYGVASGFLIVLLPFLVAFAAPVLAEEKFEDGFDRPDSVVLGEGWLVIPDEQPCINLDEDAPKAEEPVKKGHKPYAEISQGIEETVAKTQSRAAKPPIPGDQTAEINNGKLFLHFENGQHPVMVQRVFDKKVTRLSLDLTPLYAMGGVDDRAWMVVRIYYLDNEDRILGEIRYYHYNTMLDGNVNSDTIHSVVSKGSFEGEQHHVVLEAGQILERKLFGVNPGKIARSRISLEVFSNLCGAAVEGYVDNLSVILADGAGLMRFNKEEVKTLVEMGLAFHAKDPRSFAKSWIDALIKTFGREKIVAWLAKVPQDARSNPDKLIAMVNETYGLTGQAAFDTAFVIQYLLHAM